MKLPNGSKAYIPPEKLTGYLLSETHVIGKAKAKFFRALGFDEANVNLLQTELLTLAKTGDVNESVSSVHGTKYVIDGTIQTPKGGIATIRTVWIIEIDQEIPRFVTAYPIKQKND
ncbi:MAG: hypothetical protein D6681_01980 [Calditrichaeota bacterium]|nr:MAG: hypothetical protein D6681_01980 [Calditrichota bacterium]